MEKTIGFFIALLFFLLISAFVFMLAWNAIIPSLFNFRTLDFAGAFPLVVLIWLSGRLFNVRKVEEGVTNADKPIR